MEEQGPAKKGYQDPVRWKHMEVLLDQIEGMDLEQVEAYLTQHCDDERLIEEVLDFWHTGQQANDLLERPVFEDLHFLMEGEDRLLEDLESIPQCRVLDQIGEGGMGRVYLIEQVAPAKRLVALKIIHSSFLHEEQTRRFNTELGAMARMNHEHVARLLQVGLTPKLHLPYFLMEYFPGEAITEFAQKHKLSLVERLHLFMQVCRGVEHAHQQGVIHRDIKPSNILVAQKEKAPLAKVIDFGIAKALSGELGEGEQTREDSFLGTPCYMSPEQVDPGSASVDTRTDIYSLGVVLYELITGVPMINSADLKGKSLSGQISFLRNFQPLRPSKKRVELTGTLAKDLDWIFEKTTQRQKDDRYASVTALREDIQATLDYRPIAARPSNSLGYVCQKFVRRHRLGVSLALGLALALAITLGSWLLGHRRTVLAERRTRMAFNVLKGTLSSANIRLGGRQVTVAEVLGNIEAQLPKDVDPIVKATVLSASAESLVSLGNYDLALCYSQQADDLFIHNGASPTEVGENQLILAASHQKQGNTSAAEPIYNKLLSQPELPVALLNRARNGLADIFRLSGAVELALPLYQSAINSAREDEYSFYLSARGLASCDQLLGAYDQAEAMYRWALSSLEARKGKHNVEVVLTQYMLYDMLSRQGRLTDPQKLVEIYRQNRNLLGPEHLYTLEAWYVMTANLYHQGCLDSLEGDMGQVLDQAQAYLGKNNLPVQKVQTLYGLWLSRMGMTAFASTVLGDLLATQLITMDSRSDTLLVTASNLADVYLSSGQPELVDGLLGAMLAERRYGGIALSEADFFGYLTLAESAQAQGTLVALHGVLEMAFGDPEFLARQRLESNRLYAEAFLICSKRSRSAEEGQRGHAIQARLQVLQPSFARRVGVMLADGEQKTSD